MGWEGSVSSFHVKWGDVKRFRGVANFFLFFCSIVPVGRKKSGLCS